MLRFFFLDANVSLTFQFNFYFAEIFSLSSFPSARPSFRGGTLCPAPLWRFSWRAPLPSPAISVSDAASDGGGSDLDDIDGGGSDLDDIDGGGSDLDDDDGGPDLNDDGGGSKQPIGARHVLGPLGLSGYL